MRNTQEHPTSGVISHAEAYTGVRRESQEKEDFYRLIGMEDVDGSSSMTEEQKEGWFNGFLEMKSALGGDVALSLLNIRLKDTTYVLARDMRDLLYGFSQEGFEAAKTFFGEERVLQHIERSGGDICSFGAEALQRLVDVLDDSPPYDITWHIFNNSWPRVWVENVSLVEERKELFTPEEFRILLDSKTREVLIFDGRRSDWAQFVGLNDDDVEGLEKDSTLTLQSVADKIEVWREYWGADFQKMLEKAPSSYFLLSCSPDILDKFESFIPDIKYEILHSKKHHEDPFYGLAMSQDGVEVCRDTFLLFTQDEQGVLLELDIPDMLATLEWFTLPTSRRLLDTLHTTCSSEYILKMLQEPTSIEYLLSGVREYLVESDFSGNSQSKRIVELFADREEIDKELEADTILKQRMSEYPELVPFLRLGFWHARQQKLSKEVALLHARGFSERALHGAERFDSNFIPSVGVEIEVGDGTALGDKDEWELARAEFAGIPCERDNQWEFALEPSSVTVQGRMLLEMIRQGWLVPEEMQGEKYPLHINLGIPEGLTVSSVRVNTLANALTVGYANEERLRGMQYGSVSHIHTAETRSIRDKTEVRSQRYGGRVELRAFSVDAHALYRLLYDTVFVSSALFAYERQHADTLSSDSITAQLSLYWEEFEQKVGAVFKKHSIEQDLSKLQDHSVLIGMKEDVLPLIHNLSRNVRRLTRIDNDISMAA